MRILSSVKLDFDDVLICPKRSEAPSRSSVELERTYTFLNSGATWTGVPVVAANMDTVGTFTMAQTLAAEGMLTALHKHYSAGQLIEFFEDRERSRRAFMTVGIKDEDFDKLKLVMNKVAVPFLCIDAANGYTRYFVDRVKRIRETYPSVTIMAGNVATPEMVQELLISGAADIIKVGIGPGSVCTTRLMAGVGYPQLSAIIECADAAHGLKGQVCGDGGCKTPGDVAKAFAAGADFVMLGGMLAGHDECEGQWVIKDGERVGLSFYGMSSRTAVDKYAGGLKGYRAAEGREVVVPYRGPAAQTVRDIAGGLRSACAYVGASRLKDLSKCTTFVQVNRTHNRIFEGLS